MVCLHQKLLDESRFLQLRLLGLNLHVDLPQLRVFLWLLILSGLEPFPRSVDDQGQENNSSYCSGHDKAKTPGLHTDALREADLSLWREKTGGRG